jgi:phosphatidylserine/phosphatidylglycerophosphate/cardiolipin synthase-like enzyme
LAAPVASSCTVHLGGPGHAPGKLRDLLAARIAAVPSGGTIDWVTYYFRDRRLAGLLLEAQRRGVTVRVSVEGRPRAASANEAVIRMLSAPAGLGSGLRALVHTRPPFTRKRPHLHEKLYCFSHPIPHVFVGSFNPSGDEPEEEPEIVEEIRDQDRGHNLLVEIHDPPIVKALARHARRMHAAPHTLLERLSPRLLLTARSASLAIDFSPGLRRFAALRWLQRLGAGARVRIASSHLKGETAVGALVALAQRGAQVEVLAEHTQRRVPERVAQRLRQANIGVRRVEHPDRLPMHCKFILIETPAERSVLFGSFNLTERSLHFNHEICVASSSPDLFAVFEQLWETLEVHAVQADG